MTSEAVAGTQPPGADGPAGPPAAERAGRGPLLVTLVADGIGSGMFLPFAVVYFQHTTTIPLATIGFALTTAGLLSLTPLPLVGPLIDRFGPRAVAVVANLVCALAFAGYLVADSPWLLVVAAFLAGVGQGTGWTTMLGLVGLVSTPEERGHWFAVQSATRNMGYGLGGIAGAVAVGTGAHWAYPLLAVVNAVSYLVVAVLLLRWRLPARPRPAASAQQSPPGRYGTVLRDRSLQVVWSTNLLLVLCMSVLSVLLTVYVVEVLGLPAWLGGALFSLNTALVVLTQTTVTRWVADVPRPRVVQVAALLWAVSFVILWSLSAAPRWLLLPGAVVAVTVYTVAEMLHAPSISTLATEIAPPGSPGRHFAVFQLSWSLGTTLAPALLIWLLSRGTQWPWSVLLVMCAVAAVTVGRLRRLPVPR
ncbi:MFS transporter [Streptomyces sp. SL13]|uniref:MFS transporter n=1 Tax=Streptantibioticus silvisoli TaxID=2705255 RepID=A0AA90H0F9_9ACTN|nr:MFS transporter [Streptantibioticus silvisoli]MDI5968185.1 MFS transporter [Streptantibioticus silvisoli]